MPGPQGYIGLEFCQPAWLLIDGAPSGEKRMLLLQPLFKDFPKTVYHNCQASSTSLSQLSHFVNNLFRKTSEQPEKPANAFRQARYTVSVMLLLLISSRSFCLNSSAGMLPRSPLLLLLTATRPESASLSPIMSIYGIFII